MAKQNILRNIIYGLPYNNLFRKCRWQGSFKVGSTKKIKVIEIEMKAKWLKQRLAIHVWKKNTPWERIRTPIKSKAAGQIWPAPSPLDHQHLLNSLLFCVTDGKQKDKVSFDFQENDSLFRKVFIQPVGGWVKKYLCKVSTLRLHKWKTYRARFQTQHPL